MTASRPDSHLRPFCLIICNYNSSFLHKIRTCRRPCLGPAACPVPSFVHILTSLKQGGGVALQAASPDLGIKKAGPHKGAGFAPIYSFAWYYYTMLPFYFKNSFVLFDSIFILASFFWVPRVDDTIGRPLVVARQHCPGDNPFSAPID